jgi:hypothetical protein
MLSYLPLDVIFGGLVGLAMVGLFECLYSLLKQEK